MGEAHAQNGIGTANTTKDSPPLTGSLLKAEDIIKKSNAIFKGQIIRLSGPNFDATNNDGYGAKVQVLEIYKGTVDPLIDVGLHVVFGSWAGEKKPELNHPYIFL
jgi:hypothetical protein